jgi:hypothetical protein
MSEAKIRFAFICDDARREDNGKLIFIGVYGGSIVLSSFPVSLVFCLVMNIESDRPKEMPTAFQVFFDGERRTKGSTTITLQKGENFLIFPGIPLATTKPGHILIQTRFDDAEWQDVLSCEVSTPSVEPAASLSSSEQSPPAPPEL